MITQSAKKANRQNIKRRAHNVQRKTALKKVTKQYLKLIAAGNFDAAKTELPKVYKALDKSAKVGIIKPNKASRLKSRFTKLLAKKG